MNNNTGTKVKISNLEAHFSKFRQNTIGHDHQIATPDGYQKLIYADWIASGRLYQPIEDFISQKIGPYVGNTHTNTTTTGCTMTLAYKKSRDIIKKHVNAKDTDVLISSSSGMTGVVNKLQRIIGYRIHEKYCEDIKVSDRPLVLLSHMEHHSNQTSWLETIADVVVVDPCDQGLFCLNNYRKILEENKHRTEIIAAVTSCSNVTGIFTPYYDIAEIVHEYGGLCFVDFAASAPYIDIDMHPADRPEASLDAIYFSPHKFLGGPGSTGILLFNKDLYKNTVPDNPGGGTVDWTNPWGEHKYYEEIEAREDGGTPAFLQTIKVSLAMMLKDEMDTSKMSDREKELLSIIWPQLKSIPNVHILADNVEERIGALSFYIDDLHYNLAVKLLNDKFGIQVRGGCSCAGTYGHYLLHVSKDLSKSITDKINFGDLTSKPGWVRLSIHPLMTDAEARFIADAIKQVAENHAEWSNEYVYNGKINEFINREKGIMEEALVEKMFRTF
jgi:selenocysteine lyase/cysteine desulfurase